MKLFPWQKAGVRQLTKRFRRRTGANAALLQLPTGMGKSLIAVKLYQQLRKRHRNLRLIIALPKKSIPDGWKQALHYHDDPGAFFKWHKIKEGGRFQLVTRHSIVKSFLNPKPGTSALVRELRANRHLMVFDEIHRHQRLLRKLSEIFETIDPDKRADVEKSLTRALRSPRHGRRQWPKWLLLSATPINPVSLDTIDPIDRGKNADLKDGDFLTPELEDRKDQRALTSALRVTHGALAQLSGYRRTSADDWFGKYMIEAGATLVQRLDRRIAVPAQLNIWPDAEETPLKPPPGSRRQLLRTELPRSGFERSVRDVVLVNQLLWKSKMKPAQRRFVMAERFSLSGGSLQFERRNSIEGITGYSLPLVRSLRMIASRGVFGLEPPEKLRSLLALLRNVDSEHVLVFCVHRAVARAVRRHVSEEFAGDKNCEVRCAVDMKPDELAVAVKWFNAPTTRLRRVFVATEACSESIDLHLRANVLVHYELPWSPLRILQRVGRLWRLRPGDSNSAKGRSLVPKLPAVVHFVHSGSVDEEIFARLDRRWAYLRNLGLDYLEKEQAMGCRLPLIEAG